MIKRITVTDLNGRTWRMRVDRISGISLPLGSHGPAQILVGATMIPVSAEQFPDVEAAYDDYCAKHWPDGDTSSDAPDSKAEAADAEQPPA